MAIGPKSVANGKRKCTAPAVGQFGQLHAIEGYDGCTRHHPAAEISDWDRLAARFAVIDYGDAVPAFKKAPKTA